MTNRHTTWKTTRSTGDVPEGYEEIYQETLAADDLAQMVYDRRTQLGLSQAQLAERAGMKQPAISRIEGGGTTPTVPLLRRLAAALDAELNIEFVPHDDTSSHAAEELQLREATAELTPPAHPAAHTAATSARTHATADKTARQAIALVLVVAAGVASGTTTPLPSHVFDALSGSGHLAPEALRRLRGNVQAYMLQEQKLRAPADHRETAALLTLALGNELGLTTRHDWQRELPQRVGKLLDDCPTP